jgi:hypothetical protein
VRVWVVKRGAFHCHSIGARALPRKVSASPMPRPLVDGTGGELVERRRSPTMPNPDTYGPRRPYDAPGSHRLAVQRDRRERLSRCRTCTDVLPDGNSKSSNTCVVASPASRCSQPVRRMAGGKIVWDAAAGL